MAILKNRKLTELFDKIIARIVDYNRTVIVVIQPTRINSDYFRTDSRRHNIALAISVIREI